jgi:hypothetical protein
MAHLPAFHLRSGEYGTLSGVKLPFNGKRIAAIRKNTENGVASEIAGAPRLYCEACSTPDKGQCSYQVMLNVFGGIAAPYGEAQKTAMFPKTATEAYGLGLG